MRETDFNSDEVNEIVKQSRRLFDILRGFIRSEDLEIILFILSAYNDGLIDTNYNSSNINERFLDAVKRNEKYSRIAKIYAPIIEGIPYKKTEEVLHYLSNINPFILQSNFSEIFDTIFYRLLEAQGRFSGEFIQPIEISRLIMTMAELPENASVYNPFAGLASFSIFLNHNQHYFGQELMPRTWALGALRLMAYNQNNNVTYVQEDSINDWPINKKFDLIVAHPPFGLTIGGQGNYNYNFTSTYKVENFLIEHGLKTLAEGGKLISLLPAGFLFRGGRSQSLKEELINNGQIDTVITLPAGLLKHTGIAVCIVIFQNEELFNDKIRLIDAEKFVVSNGQRDKRLDEKRLISVIQSNHENEYVKFVSFEEIRSTGYNLNVQRYFAEEISGLTLVPEIGEYIRGTSAEKGKLGKLVRIRDLKDSVIDSNLDINTIEDNTLPQYGSVRKIEESCLIMAMRWKTLKPTYFKYADTPIYISNDLVAIRIDENKVNINFLINELHEDYVKDQINLYRITGVVPMIRREDLFDIKIKLPSLDEQNKKYYSAANEYIRSVVEKSQAIQDEKEINVNDENSFLRHQIAGSLKNVRGAFKFIHKILEEKVRPQFPDLYNLKISDELESTLLTYLNIMERDLKSINKSVNRVGDKIELMDLKIENFDLLEFLKEYVESLKIRSQNFYTVKLNLDENAIKEFGIKGVYIEGDKDVLRKMFDNIVENAEKHAFTYGINNGNENKLEIDLFYDFEDFTVQIDFTNTGKPLPENITYDSMTRKGSSSGKNSGDGIGIWFVSEVMKIHKGQFGFTDETGPEGIGGEFATTIELTFPIIPAI